MVTPWKMSSRIEGRSLIKGAAPARGIEGQDITPEPVSAEHNFAGGEPEPVEEDLAVEEPGHLRNISIPTPSKTRQVDSSTR